MLRGEYIQSDSGDEYDFDIDETFDESILEFTLDKKPQQIGNFSLQNIPKSILTISATQSALQTEKYYSIRKLTQKLASLIPQEGFTIGGSKLEEICQILTDLAQKCDDEKSIRRFLQTEGIKHLKDLMENFISTSYYNDEEKFKVGSIVKCDNENRVQELFELYLKMLGRLAGFPSTWMPIESSHIVDVMVILLEMKNGYFTTSVPFCNGLDRQTTIKLSAKKINVESNWIFSKRILPTSMIGCRLNAFVYKPIFSDNRSKFVDKSEKMPFNQFGIVYENEFYETKEVFIANQIDNITFWALDFEKQFEILQKVQTEIFTDCKPLKLWSPDKLRFGQLVLVSAKIACSFNNNKNTKNDWNLFRALVIGFNTEDNYALVFAVDFGQYFRVPFECLIKMPQKLLLIEAAAMLFIAEDRMPETDEKMYLLINAVNSLCHHQLLAESFVRHDSFLRNLSFWLDSTSWLKNPSLSLLLTLSSYSIVKTELQKKQIVEKLIGFLLNKEKLQSPVQKLLSLRCLINLASSNRTNRRKIIKLLPELRNWIKSNNDNNIVSDCLHLIKNLFTNQSITKNWKLALGNMVSRNEYLNRHIDSIDDYLKFSDYSATSVDKSICESMLNELNFYKEEQSKMENYDQNNLKLKYGQTFEFDNKLNGSETWQVAFDIQDVRNIKTNVVQSYVCATLNSKKRLVLNFGLKREPQENNNTEIWTVEGIPMNAKIRDTLRVALDIELSKKFQPVLQPHLYDVRFLPVVVSDQNPEKSVAHNCHEELRDVESLFLIQIRVPDVSHQTYKLVSTGSSFSKCETTNEPIEMQSNKNDVKITDFKHLDSRQYVLNHEIYLENSNIWLLTLHEDDLNMMSDFFLFQIRSYVCAAMNSQCRLLILFGIDENDGKIAGFKMGLKKRIDWCRETDLAIKRALRPVLEPNFYSVRFVPVQNETSIDSNDDFVAEIRVEPDVKENSMVYQIESTGQVFFKCNLTAKPRLLPTFDYLSSQLI